MVAVPIYFVPIYFLFISQVALPAVIIKQKKILPSVGIVLKYNLPVVAALGDVMRITGDY